MLVLDQSWAVLRGTFSADTRQWLSQLMRDCRHYCRKVRQFVFTLTPQHFVRACETCIHSNSFGEHRGQYYRRNDDRECPDSVSSYTVPVENKQAQYCLFYHGGKNRGCQPQIEHGASTNPKHYEREHTRRQWNCTDIIGQACEVDLIGKKSWPIFFLRSNAPCERANERQQRAEPLKPWPRCHLGQHICRQSATAPSRRCRRRSKLPVTLPLRMVSLISQTSLMPAKPMSRYTELRAM